ncbi:tetratricopeptide repeat protein [Mucilaginibacter jinjuensis]|uniref:Tetratricopeptide repeat protein n=1 Tax=Mucilaginibacter jinjuensis TaxID=1176721 RepID=A0ABY7T3Q9_9SPHI|nr:tetratricopeptide repeat protein [Mucilaginibacter jinjuensis]WCT09922.1 tetratricopeptide repeat protein [Mucilaginibacter jinjuensis]
MKKLSLLIFLLFIVFTSFAQSKQVDSLKHLLTIAKQDTERLWLNNQISSKYQDLGNYPMSLSHALTSLKLAESLNLKKEIGNVYMDLSFIYGSQKDKEKSIEYELKAQQLFSTINEPVNLAIATYVLSSAYADNHQYQLALKYAQLAYQMVKNLGNRMTVLQQCEALTTLGQAHFGLHNYLVAQGYYQQSLVNAIKAKSNYGMFINYQGLSALFNSNGKTDSCIYYTKKELETAKLVPYLPGVIEANELLAKLYATTDPKQAIGYYQHALLLKDSTFNEQKIRQVQNLTYNEQQRQRELQEEKEKQLEERKENLQLSAIALFIVVFLLVALLLSRTRTHRRIIEFMSVLSLLLIFEFITLLIHPWVEKLTNHTPVFELLILVALAAVLVPLHHNLTHWLKEKLVHAQEKVVGKIDEEQTEE